jgi:inosose dehydratase
VNIAYTGWTWLINHKDNPKFELEQAIKECKHLGYDFLENFAFIADYYEDPLELVALLNKYDAKMVNLYGHFSNECNDEDYDRSVKQIDFLAAIGGTYYNCQAAMWKEAPLKRPTDAAQIAKYAALSNRLGAYAKAKGVALCFHPHAQTAVFAEDQIDCFVKDTDPSAVWLCLDTAHTTIGGMSAPRAFGKYASRLGYVHLKDVDPTAAQGEQPMAAFRALGLGTVDFVGVLAALRNGGYDGTLCVELDNPEVCNYQSAEVSRKYIKNALKL